MSTAIRCFRSAYSEWTIDSGRGMYRRVPRTDTDTVANSPFVPYRDSGWRPYRAFVAQPLATGRFKLIVHDIEDAEHMNTTVDEVFP